MEDIKILKILVEDFKNSGVPMDRLFFLNSIKQLISCGERLDKLAPSSEIKEINEELKGHINNYTLYPKLNPPT